MGSRQMILIKRWQKLAKKFIGFNLSIEATPNGEWFPQWYDKSLDFTHNDVVESFEDAIIWLELEMKWQESQQSNRRKEARKREGGA